MPDNLQPRRSGRLTLEADIVVRRSGFPNFRVRIEDISPEGCKIEFVDTPTVGERVWVKFDGLTALEGHVCWVRQPDAGIRFEKPLHEAVFDHLIDQLR